MYYILYVHVIKRDVQDKSPRQLFESNCFWTLVKWTLCDPYHTRVSTFTVNEKGI